MALLSLAAIPGAVAAEVPRTVIALFDSRYDDTPGLTTLHRHLEMPLNHLGLRLEYHDISRGLPDIVTRQDVRGVVTWPRGGTDVPDPVAWTRWLSGVLDAGKRYVSFGRLPASDGATVPLENVNAVLEAIGVRVERAFGAPGLGATVASADPDLVGFERAPRPPLPFVARTRATGDARSVLSVREAGPAAALNDVVVLGRQGGYAAPGFAVYRGRQVNHRQWILDPFEFLRQAFATDELPKPDTTTLVGRRIYYSHIDGDGWRNVSLVDEYAESRVLSARVVLEELIRPYPDLPVTVAPIAADLDPAWYGSGEARRLAQEILTQPQVEIATHTYSHPFYWRFFERYTADKEQPLLARYRRLGGDKALDWTGYGRLRKAGNDVDLADLHGYHVPRAYAREPFDLDLEVSGSVAQIAALAPPGKAVTLLQWSGDTTPFAAALDAVAEAGLGNINGGDSRFDRAFPSYAYVAPVGIARGAHYQVYASNSNENTYTDNWRSAFFAFRFLTETLERTETPRRVRAANVYYHMYSGERLAALQAVLRNLAWARGHELVPIEASRYAAIGQGFHSARIHAVGPQAWEIRERGALDTLRFDAAGALGVDWQRSRGVLGQRRHQGSLYVALEEGFETPRVALAPRTSAAGAAPPLYLEHARWRVFAVTRKGGGLSARAAGYGRGEMTWRGTPGQAWQIEIDYPDGRMRRLDVRADAHGRFSFVLDPEPARAVHFSIRPASGSAAG